MDAAGKDGAIKHVLSGVNPQGCHVTAFKAPSAEELDHDYLWRCMKALPERGRIGIFNRSYYEEVLVVRVHEALLAGQKLPPAPRHEEDLEASLRGHPQLRALSRTQRHADPQVLPARVEGRAEEALPRAPRRPRQELEIRARRRARARPLGRLHGGLPGHDPPHGERARARGTSCRPTTSGSRASWSRPRSSRACRRWISPIRGSTTRSARNSPSRATRSCSQVEARERLDVVGERKEVVGLDAPSRGSRRLPASTGRAPASRRCTKGTRGALGRSSVASAAVTGASSPERGGFT